MEEEKALGKRFWEIDSLRGIAIIMMIAFHLLFDMNHFAKAGFDLYSGFWFLLGRAAAVTFLFLVGLSLTLSYSRTRKQGKAGFSKYLRRGIRIFLYGLIITLITWAVLPQGAIWFGVLHLIGLSIILAYPLLRKGFLVLFLGIAIIIIGLYMQNFTFNFLWLLWLGLRPLAFYTFDYLPLLPWFGVVLIGVFFGNLLYPDYKRRFRIRNLSGFPPLRGLAFLGRHSLIIYLLHQPVLLGLLYLFVL
jgi:uncharacterized membrane protein